MIFESHAHYDDEAFDADRETILEQCQRDGIEYIVKESRAASLFLFCKGGLYILFINPVPRDSRSAHGSGKHAVFESNSAQGDGLAEIRVFSCHGFSPSSFD